MPTAPAVSTPRLRDRVTVLRCDGCRTVVCLGPADAAGHAGMGGRPVCCGRPMPVLIPPAPVYDATAAYNWARMCGWPQTVQDA